MQERVILDALGFCFFSWWVPGLRKRKYKNNSLEKCCRATHLFQSLCAHNFLLKRLCSEKDMRLKHVRYVKQLRYVQNISLANVKLLWKHWHTKQTAYSYKYFLLKVDGIWNVAFPYFFVLLFFFLNLSISYNEEYKKNKFSSEDFFGKYQQICKLI